ncbi:MAG: hypothetical protein JWM10_3368 [Myxococcaceae bacterium]|nr:hypothetical protein [Myxococcaceae bacterium]
MAKQQSRNDDTRSGETPTAYGMMTNANDRSRNDRGQEQSAGSVVDRASSTDPAVEQDHQQASGDAQSSIRHNANGNGNGNGNGGRGESHSMRDGDQGRTNQGQSNRGQSNQGQSNQGQSFDQGRDGQRQSTGQGRSQEQGSSWGTAEGRRRPWRQSPQVARDVMTRNPRTVKPSDGVQQIAQLMIDEDTGIIPVVDGARLVGVVTDRDIVCRLVAGGVDLKNAKASDVMTTEVECVTEEDSLQEVLEVMGDKQIRRVGVVGKDDRLVGIISMADLAREADVDRRLQETFEEISAQRSFWSKMR